MNSNRVFTVDHVAEGNDRFVVGNGGAIQKAWSSS